LPFIDPACASLGAASQFDYEIASNFSAQDDTEFIDTDVVVQIVLSGRHQIKNTPLFQAA